MRSQKKLNLSKPGKSQFVLLAAVLFLFVCIILYSFPSILPRIESGPEEIVVPNVSKPSLSLFNTHLKSKNIQFDTMKIATESPTVVVYLSNGAYAYLDFHADAASQVDLLSRIILRIAQDTHSKKLKYIDLRFDKPVVKF